MKKLFVLFLLFPLFYSNAQGNELWASYFSYNNIQDMSESGTRVFAAAEVAMFSKNLASNELKTITSVDGLKAETITAIHHSSAYNKTLVGNDNGLLIVIKSDGSILNVIDIIQETTVQPSLKRINHIFENDGKAYISTDFGIAVFNLSNNEFGDTYYMGPGGSNVRVFQTAVLDGRIYAATAANGIRSASLNNANLNDFNQWTEDTPGGWDGVVAINNTLYAAAGGGTLYRRQNGTYNFAAQMPSRITDLRAANGYMLVTCSSRINVYNPSGQQVIQINLIPNADIPVTFTAATVVNESVFVGTVERGVYSAPLANTSFFEKITPDGPVRSKVFSLEKTTKYLWAVYGDYNGNYNPYPLEQFGISRFSEAGWETIPNDELSNASSISDIEANPFNEKQVYAGSYHNGLLRITDGTPEPIFDQTNTGPSGLQSLVLSNDGAYRSVRINSLTFDGPGNLWMTNAMVDKPLKVLKSNNTWASYSFADVIPDVGNESYGKMAIDRNGTKWIPSIRNGIVAFNEAYDNKFILINGEDAGMPSPFARSVAIDNNNQVWIGTERGLRIVQSADSFLSETTLTARSIIILEDGLAQELMYEQSVMDIAVDGANNKWLGTASSGAFLVSPDGQSTLYHFTKQNSPLPSNNIIDIEIDPVNGDVYFATDKGLVAFKGTSTKASDDLSNVYVFPNPVRPGFDGDVNISGLTDNANVKITDIEGNLVYEATSEGGTILWNTKAFGKHKVASGVYMIFISSEDGLLTKVKKVMIIR